MSVSLVKTYSRQCENDSDECQRTATRVITYLGEFIHESGDDQTSLWNEELCSSCARWTYPGERVFRRERPDSVYTISVLSVDLLSTVPVPA